MTEFDTLAHGDMCFVITIEIATDKHFYAIYNSVSYEHELNLITCLCKPTFFFFYIKDRSILGFKIAHRIFLELK